MRSAATRVIPFAIYIAFLAMTPYATDMIPGLDARWLYPVKMLFVMLALALCWRSYTEFEDWRLGAHSLLLSLLAGAIVFALWINLDQAFLSIGGLEAGKGYNPLDSAGRIDWAWAVPRVLGAALVVPVMEELFWRSLVMRWLERPRFLTQAPTKLGSASLFISALVFGFEHQQWFAGLIAGLVYGELYRRSGKLSAPVLAHGVTNLLLGIWVIHSRQWQFW